jgi:hypothetical protein
VDLHARPELQDTHLIPEDDALLTLGWFDEFVTAREALIRERLHGVLSG